MIKTNNDEAASVSWDSSILPSANVNVIERREPSSSSVIRWFLYGKTSSLRQGGKAEKKRVYVCVRERERRRESVRESRGNRVTPATHRIAMWILSHTNPKHS